MRVVNKNLWHALVHGQACRASVNTRCDDQANVYLHGHPIARLKSVTGSVENLSNWEFNLCGWHTVTTLDRLNDLSLNVTGGFNAYQHKIWLEHGQAYRGERTSKRVPCPRGVDPKAHGELHHADDARVALPDSGWFDARYKP